MFSGILRKLRDAQLVGVGIFLTSTCAAIGLVWLSVALDRLLTMDRPAASASAAVGAVFLAPVFIAVIALMLRRKERERPLAIAADLLAVPHLPRVMQDLAQRAPLAAIALAAFVGFLSARFPAAINLLVQAFLPAGAPPPTARSNGHDAPRAQ